MNHALIAVIAYLTGAVTIFAYVNRNRYLDLLMASVGLIAYGTSSTMIALRILPFWSFLLARLAIVYITISVALLAIRIARTFYVSFKKYLGLK
ncbi:MAG: hypothetical protein Q8J63_01785 [Candidatus Aquicultor sp.]|nr:hypothetical protein [Candidatus Aquicultor sp.]